MKNVLTIALIGIFLLNTGCGCTKKETKEEVLEKKDTFIEDQVSNVNKNSEVIDDKEKNGFKFTNTSLIYENGMSTLVTEVTNEGSESKYLGTFNIYAKDKDGNTIVTLSGLVDDELAPGESKTITASISINISNAYSIEYDV